MGSSLLKRRHQRLTTPAHRLPPPAWGASESARRCRVAAAQSAGQRRRGRHAASLRNETRRKTPHGRRAATGLSASSYTLVGMSVETPGPLQQPAVQCSSSCTTAIEGTPTVGEHVRVVRQAAGLTQQQLADRAGTTQPVIARLELGVRLPTLRTLEKVARALGQDFHLLVPGSSAVAP